MQTQSDQINELITALAKAQGEMKNAAKTSVNPHFKSKYADLSEFLDASREPLSKNNLAILQTVGRDEKDSVCLITMLAHGSGQYIKSIYPLICKDITNAQAMGSAMTYARRYSLGAIIGIAPDDDAEQAVGRYDTKLVQNKPDTKLAQTITEIDEKKLINQQQMKMFNDCYEKCDDEFRKFIDQTILSLKIEDLSQLDEKNFKRFMKTFDTHLGNLKKAG